MRAFLLIAGLLATACRTYQPQYKIVAYVYRGRADYSRISAQKLTHINYAFGRIDNNGEIILNDPDAPAYLAQLQALKARNPSLKIILSIGGWGADNFSDAALTDESRETFANSAIDFVKCYALDGIDLDWEYPGQPGPGIKFRPEDKQNFTLLLKTLRHHLDALSDERKRKGSNRYTLSIASAGGKYFEHTEMDKLHVYLDWINVMAYDFAGNWSKTTGHHTALYAAEKSQPSTESFVTQHLQAGIPRNKIVVGVAFFGKGWFGSRAENHGLYQPYDRYGSGYPYSKLWQGFQGTERRWDRQARAPYLWNPETGMFISYDDPQSLREKTKFIRFNRLGGVMFWEYSEDPDEILLDVLYADLQ